MGAYMSEPCTKKDTEDGFGSHFNFAATAMQGWRTNQEDAHNCLAELTEGWSLFAVYDGHGGAEVSKYTAQKFPDFLRRCDLTDDGESEEKITKVMQDIFLEFDDHLRSGDVMKILKEIAEIPDDATDDEDKEGEAMAKLVLDAKMPLKELLSRFGRKLLKRGVNKALVKEDNGSELEGPESGDKSENGDAEEEEAEEEEEEKVEARHKRPICSSEHTTPKKSRVEDATDKEEVKEDKVDEDEETEAAPGKAEEGASGSAAIALDDDSDTSDDDYEEEESVDDEEDEEDEDEAEEDGDEAAESEEAEEIGEEEEEGMEKSGFGCPMGAEVPGEDSGTTACVCLLNAKKAVVANIGDSRAVLSRAGKAIDLSVDHKPEDESEKTRIEKAGGRISEEGRVNDGLNLSRAFGDHTYKKNNGLSLAEQMISALPDVKIVDLLPEDEFILIACDGIWNSLESQQVVDFVKKRITEGMTASQIVEQLCEACLAQDTSGDGSGCDNMTVILVDLKKQSLQSQ